MESVLLPVGTASKLIVIPADRFTCELLGVTFVSKLTRETAQKNAMLPELLRRGTIRYPTRALLDRHLCDLYSMTLSSSNYAFGDCQMLEFSLDFLAARFVGGKEGLLPQAIRLLSEILTAPALDANGLFQAAFVNNEKKHLTDAIRAEMNSPRAFAAARCRELLCNGEPFALSLIGNLSDAEKLTPECLTARYHEFLSTLTPVFTYVGATPPEEVARQLAAAFPLLSAAGSVFETSLFAQKAPVVTGEVTMPISQSRLSLGFRSDIGVNDPLSPAFRVMNEIYGGSAVSKLFLHIREEKSLCYYCASNIHPSKGLLFVGCGVKPENMERAKEAILAEFEEMKAGHVSEKEFVNAKKSLLNACRQRDDSPLALSRFFLSHLLLEDGETPLSQRLRLEAVTPEEVQRAAKRVSLGAVFSLRGGNEEGEDEF